MWKQVYIFAGMNSFLLDARYSECFPFAMLQIPPLKLEIKST